MINSWERGWGRQESLCVDVVHQGETGGDITDWSDKPKGKETGKRETPPSKKEKKWKRKGQKQSTK